MDEKVDGQDLMNLYNAHRFRSTDKNFTILKRKAFNAASYYSGGYQSNYIGKPNYCVTLLLEENDNPNEYEKVLIKVTNNLLTQMDQGDFDAVLLDTFQKLDERRFDDIKVTRDATKIEETSAPKKELATTSSASISDEEKIFAELMESEDLDTKDKEFDSKLSDFEKSAVSSDPFSAGASTDPFTANPFAATGSDDPFATNPFDAAQKPSLDKAFGVDEALGKAMFQQKRTTAAEIVIRLDSLEKNRPQKPKTDDKESKYKYMETLVSFLEEKVKILGTLANQIKDLENAHEEKDKLIGKLLLSLKG